MTDATPANPRTPGTTKVQPGLQASELDRIRRELESDLVRLSNEVGVTEYELTDSLRSGRTEGTGDHADAGDLATHIEQESSLTNNAQGLVRQTARALARMESGRYGICDRCSQAIDVERLRAFPRATMCLPCRTLESQQR